MTIFHAWARPALGLLLLAGLVAGCGGGDDEPAEPAATVPSSPAAGDAAPTATAAAVQPTATQAAPEATPTEAPPVLEQRESTDVPRSVRFSDMTYTVTDAVVTKAVLRSYDGPEPDVSEDTHLVLHLTVRNELNGRVQHFNLNFFKLETGDATLDAVQVPGQPVFTSQAASATDVLIAFEVAEDFDFAGATLVVAEPGTEPASLPLTGAVPESGYPFSIEVAAGDQQVTSGNPCGTTMVVTPLAAEVDLDARIDGAGSASAIDGSRRAAEGERFVRLDMRATGDSGQCGGANVIDDQFRLQIDDVPRGTVNNVNDIVRPGEAIDFQLLYRVPADAQALVLLAGAPAGIVVEYPLTFEALSP